MRINGNVGNRPVLRSAAIERGREVGWVGRLIEHAAAKHGGDTEKARAFVERGLKQHTPTWLLEALSEVWPTDQKTEAK